MRWLRPQPACCSSLTHEPNRACDQLFGPPAAAGTYAEFVAADEDTICAIPPGVSFIEAAAVPMAGLTAWQALAPMMPLAGKRVLVHGGAGGMGGFGVQVRLPSAGPRSFLGFLGCEAWGV